MLSSVYTPLTIVSHFRAHTRARRKELDRPARDAVFGASRRLELTRTALVSSVQILSCLEHEAPRRRLSFDFFLLRTPSPSWHGLLLHVWHHRGGGLIHAHQRPTVSQRRTLLSPYGRSDPAALSLHTQASVGGSVVRWRLLVCSPMLHRRAGRCQTTFPGRHRSQNPTLRDADLCRRRTAGIDRRHHRPGELQCRFRHV